MIHLACQQNDCVVDIGSAQVINFLLHVLRSNANSVGLCLDTLYTLLSHTPIVKETLAKGGKTIIDFQFVHINYLTIIVILCRSRFRTGRILQ